ncbi:MAG: anthranilate phosphoribosyltransferase [Planctomycetota bacterium]|nr:MAG: anthranilate phosphoribosyltransferase [Planctomycetota bacterium]
MDLRQALQQLAAGAGLSRQQAKQVISASLREDVDPVLLAAFLAALAQRGETVEEITGAAEALRAAMIPFEHDCPEAVDNCGTGGDGLGLFNLSTTAALVAAAAGATVIKHGNRASSSRCGSADLLEAAGVALELDASQSREVLEEVGICFLFAPNFHPAMRFAAPVRRTLGIRTLFNFLGPLANPGGVRRHLLGLSDGQRVPAFAEVLRELQVERAYVVHGFGGADELTLGGDNLVAEVGPVPATAWNAAELGLSTASVSELQGGDSSVNLKLLQDVLTGERGPVHDAVVLNAAATLVTAGRAAQPQEGVAMARESLASGRAADRLKAWVACSHKVSKRTTA